MLILKKLARKLVACPHLFAVAATGAGLRKGIRVSVDHGAYAIRHGQSEVRLSLAHAPYVFDVIREFNYYFSSVVPVARGTTSVVDFSRPGFHSIPGLEIDVFFTSLPEAIQTNEAYLNQLKVQTADVIINAGAYCGLTSYIFARAVGPEGRVIALEADPVNFEALEKNIAHWGVTNITAVHAALWDEVSEVQFASEGNLGSSIAAIGSRRTNIVSVPATTLARLCADYALNRVDHVKLDIEGAEYPVLRSCSAFIKKYSPDFIIEVHRNKNAIIDVKELQQIFSKQHYRSFCVKQSAHEKFPLLYACPETP